MAKSRKTRSIKNKTSKFLKTIGKTTKKAVPVIRSGLKTIGTKAVPIVPIPPIPPNVTPADARAPMPKLNATIAPKTANNAVIKLSITAFVFVKPAYIKTPKSPIS